MSSIQAKVINTSYYSTGFPQLKSSNYIERENFIAEIKNTFEKDKSIVFLSGENDIGKTSFCAEFVRKNNNSLSLFFNEYNSLDLNVEFVRINLYNQIEYFLGNEIKDENAFISSEKYRLALFNLKKRFRKGRDLIYLIVDGLSCRGSAHLDNVMKIFEEIPFGEDHFKFIITGSSDEFVKLNKSFERIPIKDISLIGFTNHQVELFLGSENYTSIRNFDILETTRNYPGRLGVLKRLLDNDNIEVKEIGKSSDYKNWLDLDTSKINFDDSETSLILSLLSLSDKNFSVKDISLILQKPIEKVSDIIEKIHIINSEGNNIIFISTAHAKFIAGLMRANKQAIQKLLIKFYASDQSLDNTYLLSKLLSEQKKYKEVSELIDEKFIEGTIKTTGSIERVNETIDLGFRSSEEMKAYANSYKFSVQGSIIQELDNYQFWESEILARISLKDFLGAINLAEKAVLKVDRLKLLL